MDLVALLNTTQTRDTLPATLEIPQSLAQQMFQAQKYAAQRKKETGALLLLKEGKLAFGGVVEGEQHSVDLKKADVKPWDGKAVGTFHTHFSSEGLRGQAFSGGDLSGMTIKNFIEIVQSDDNFLFAMYNCSDSLDVPSDYKSSYESELEETIKKLAVHKEFEGYSDYDVASISIYHQNMTFARKFRRGLYSGANDGTKKVSLSLAPTNF